MAALRILIVDDAAVYRKILRELLATIPDVEVIGVASNGKMALDAMESLQPDLVTLDVEMPELDGLGVLKEVKRRRLAVNVLMLSSLTRCGAEMTVRALRAGAFDFVPKPSKANPQLSREALRLELTSKIEAFKRSRSSHPKINIPTGLRTCLPTSQVEVVAIGVSTGGPSSLAQLLPKLPSDFPVPIVIVQHMPPIFTKSLAADLDRLSALEVVEASEGDVLQGGRVFIAPGGRQMRLQRIGNEVVVHITDDPPEKSCKPSVDYLFRSVAEVFGSRAVAAVLTGMGDDGMLGCQRIKHDGGTIIAQDQATSVVFGMPRAVIENGLANIVLPLSEISSELLRLAAIPSLSAVP